MDKNLRNKLIMVFTIAIIAMVIVAGLYYTVFSNRRNLGSKAPNFQATTVDDGKIELEDYQGRVVILDFMATWCGPCKEEIEHLKKIRSKYESEEVKIISIDIDDTETTEQVRSFKNNYNANWTFVINGKDVAQRYDVTAIPKIYIIDREGRISFKRTGVTSEDVLQDEVDKLVKT